MDSSSFERSVHAASLATHCPRSVAGGVHRGVPFRNRQGNSPVRAVSEAHCTLTERRSLEHFLHVTANMRPLGTRNF